MRRAIALKGRAVIARGNAPGQCELILHLSPNGARSALPRRLLTSALVAAAIAWPGWSAAQAEEKTMSLEKTPFGKMPDGGEVELYTLTNRHGLSVRITNYGAIVTSVRTPDRDGRLGEITLGFDSLDEYLAGHPFFGAIAGRFANRIAAGRFTIDGVEYQLATNNGPNHLHGGNVGFDKKVWKAEPVKESDRVGVKLSLVSPDGDEGYPGNLAVTVVYTLTDADELRIEYTAKTDKATPINLTNHAYWNLADGGKSSALGHRLTLNAEKYLPVDAGAIPTGELRAVKGTPMDFTRETSLGERIEQVGGTPGGYDHCYVLNKPPGGEGLTLAAKVVEPVSGRVMEVYTTEPGIQLYTANYMDGSLKSRGAVFKSRHAFCLEAQHFPDSINQPAFPSTLLKPGETYRQTTVHKFSTLK
jgi:aldose 1-epimerase